MGLFLLQKKITLSKSVDFLITKVIVRYVPRLVKTTALFCDLEDQCFAIEHFLKLVFKSYIILVNRVSVFGLHLMS